MNDSHVVLISAVLGFLSSPLAGLVINKLFAAILPADHGLRAATTTYLAATPGQMMAVAQAVKAKKAADIYQAIDAVAAGVSQAAKAGQAEAEQEAPK